MSHCTVNDVRKLYRKLGREIEDRDAAEVASGINELSDQLSAQYDAQFPIVLKLWKESHPDDHRTDKEIHCDSAFADFWKQNLFSPCLDRVTATHRNNK